MGFLRSLDAQHPDVPPKPSTCQNRRSTHVTYILTIVAPIASLKECLAHWDDSHPVWAARVLSNSHGASCLSGAANTSHKRRDGGVSLSLPIEWPAYPVDSSCPMGHKVPFHVVVADQLSQCTVVLFSLLLARCCLLVGEICGSSPTSETGLVRSRQLSGSQSLRFD